MSAAMPALRLVLACLALGAGTTCTAGPASLIATTAFAIGYEGELSGPLLFGPCESSPQTFSPLFTRVNGEGRPWYRATAVGRLEVRCGSRDTWVVVVREPVRFTVTAPETLTVGQRDIAVLNGVAAGGERLVLGAFADVGWKATGAVREARPLPHDFLGAAIQLHSDITTFAIEGVEPGTGSVAAGSWRGRSLDASATIQVTAAPARER